MCEFYYAFSYSLSLGTAYFVLVNIMGILDVEAVFVNL